MTCPWCKSSFSPRPRGGAPQRYCTPACRKNANDAKRRFSDALETDALGVVKVWDEALRAARQPLLDDKEQGNG